MEHESFFAEATDESVFARNDHARVELAAATFAAPHAAAIQALIEAAQVVIPDGAHVVHMKVTPGEVVELPFGPDAHFLARLGDGNLAIKVGDVTVILQGYADASSDPQHPVIVESADGHPLDIATLLAATDPALDIQTAAGPGGNGGQGADNSGAILQPFGAGEGGLGGFEGAGTQGDSTGPNGAGAPDTDGINNPSSITTNSPANVAPVAADLAVTTDEDTKFTGTLPATDANGDPLTYSVVGALPKFVTVNADGTWSFDPSGNYDQLNTGDHATLSFQYKANDGQADSNIGTVTIDVTGVNDPPQIVGELSFIQLNEESQVIQHLSDVTVITDPDSTSFTYALDGTIPTGISIDPDGTLHLDLKGHYDSLPADGSQTLDVHYTVSDGLASSNVVDLEVKIQGVNDAPVIGGTATALSYTENDPATAIDGAATVSDIDSANFNGGSLTVSLGATGLAEDQLAIIDQGTGAGQIGIIGSDVTYGGATIGTWSGGANGADLVIHFTSDDATTAAAQALLRDIGYANSSDNPSGADRSASFTLVDGDGTANGGTDTGTAGATIHVTPVNDAPVVTPHAILALVDLGGNPLPLPEDYIGTFGSVSAISHDAETPSNLLTYNAVSALPLGFTFTSDGVTHADLTGHYDYLKEGQTISFSFTYHASDGQAFSNIGLLSGTIVGVNDAPTAIDDTVITNNDPTTVPDWAFLANDKDPDSPNLSVDITALNGLTSIVHPPAAGTTTIFDDQTPGGSFTYKASDGSLESGTATVSIQRQEGPFINGGAGHEIIVAGPGGATIDGHGGNDLIFGNDGDDTIRYHPGDVVSGGSDTATGAQALLSGARGDVLISNDDLDLTGAATSFIDKTGHGQHTFSGIETVSLLNVEAGDPSADPQTLAIDAAGVRGMSDHTITMPFGLGEAPVVQIDADAVDQLYLSVSADTSPSKWIDTGFVGSHEIYAHTDNATGVADAYVTVSTAAAANVHLNTDAP